tara:strand:- start:59 stop:508 length:450 start_codon:yes stop_codon:yes gene_type:complete
MALVDNLHAFDNLLGYRWGYLFWLSMFTSNFVVLCADSTQNVGRDYLTNTVLMSCLTLVYYYHYRHQNVPASTPAMHAAGTEGLARYLLAAHYGFSNVVEGSNAIAYLNYVMLVMSGLFALSKTLASIHTVHNFDIYTEYANRQKDTLK